jgi:antitoxin PrlF
MVIARSKITAQGQLSMPAEVRRRLGVGPGATVEWDEDGGIIVVRKAARFTSAEAHALLFPEGPPRRRTLEEMDDAIRKAVIKRHARR